MEVLFAGLLPAGLSVISIIIILGSGLNGYYWKYCRNWSCNTLSRQVFEDMIYITGDTHGDIMSRWGFSSHPKLHELNKADTMIQLGDFGVVFDPKYFKESKYMLDWLEDTRPWGNTIIIGGNHENWDWWLDQEEVEIFGGKARRPTMDGRTYEHIFFVTDPTIMDIEDEHILMLPRADSHDIDNLLDPNDKNFKRKRKSLELHNKFYRTIGKNWWANESMPIEEVRAFIKQHENEHFTIILSHDYPGSVNEVSVRPGGSFRLASTPAQEYLEVLRNTLDFDSWMFGHFHLETAQWNFDDRLLCLYHEIIAI